jgi:hypothetical protein
MDLTSKLLSPQSVFHSVGGEGCQDNDKYTLCLAGGEILLDAPYGRANLPILQLIDPALDQPKCFWTRCFSFSASTKDVWAKNILDAANQNLTLAQKSERIAFVAPTPCSRRYLPRA